MRRGLSILLVLVVAAFAGSSWAQCPADADDYGICDTLYVEAWGEDLQYDPGQGPYFVRVPIYVTHDLVTHEDSLASFVVPLCYTQTNPSFYCSLSEYWNNTSVLWADPNFPRSIFRHIPIEGTTDTVHNRMADLAADFSLREWDTRILDLAGSGPVTDVFWLSMFATGSQDQRWWESSKVLLATMTFKLEDSMSVCLDSCFWPPNSQLVFVNDGHGGSSITPRPGSSVDGTYTWCFNFGTEGVKEIVGSEESRPTEFSLSQNYPNPFNPYTNFRFTLAKSAHVKIEIFNIVGQRVRMLVDEEMKAGVYLADWDSKDDKGNSVSSGVYFYRMQAGDFSDMKKMLLVK